MLKSNSREFFSRCRAYFGKQYGADGYEKFYTIEEKALAFKISVEKYAGKFTPDAVKDYKINSGGAFFHGVRDTVAVLAELYCSTQEEKQAYIEKYMSKYYKTENDDFIINAYANVLYKTVDKLARKVDVLPEIELKPAVMAALTYWERVKYYSLPREYGYFIISGYFVEKYYIDKCKSAPNVREKVAQNVLLVIKNGELYDVI